MITIKNEISEIPYYRDTSRELPERLTSGYLCLTFEIDHFLYDFFNRKMKQLQSSGVMQRLVEQPKRPAPEEYSGPTVLTVEHLAIGFYIWAIAAVVATAAFCFEHVKHGIEMLLYKLAFSSIRKTFECLLKE